MLYWFLGLYEFMHQGHCAGGWKGPNTNQANIVDCRNECAKCLNVGYFAYRTGNNCACYLAEYECPDDGKFYDHNAYRIVREGILLIDKLSYYLFYITNERR